MIIVTTNSIENRVINKYLGLVNANQVTGTNFFSDLDASFSDIFGGTSGTYRNKLDNLYNSIMNMIETKASAIGADAVVGLRVDFDEISGKGKSMFMLTAVGTAVETAVDTYAIYRKIHELKIFENDGLITHDEFEREVKKIKAGEPTEIEKESIAIRVKNEELEKEKEREQRRLEIKRLEQKKRDEELAIIEKSFSDQLELSGFNVGDLLEIYETGDITSIDHFTKDGRIVCKINGEYHIYDIDNVTKI